MPFEKGNAPKCKIEFTWQILVIFLFIFSIMMENYVRFASCKKFFRSELKGVK